MLGTRVILADDHTLMLDAIKKLLEPEFEVVGTFGDGCALIEAAPEAAIRIRAIRARAVLLTWYPRRSRNLLEDRTSCE